MRISSAPHFMILCAEATLEDSSVRIIKSFDASFSHWSRSSRISPIYRLSRDSKPPKFPDLEDGEHNILLLGPCNPAKLMSEVDFSSLDTADIHISVTTGILNIALIFSSAKKETLIKTVTAWAEKEKLAYEVWYLSAGNFSSPIITSKAYENDAEILTQVGQLAKIAESGVEKILQPTIMEYCSIMASAISRAGSVSSYFYRQLSLFHEFIMEITSKFYENKSELNVLEIQSRILNVNAALSRFTSQTFSGVPPVLNTECHFWTHSLFGTGSANLALANIAKFAESRIGEWNLPDRLLAMKEINQDVPSVQDLMSDAALVSDEVDLLSLAGEHMSEEQLAPTVSPVITYFSGRDGFSSLIQTLSAPLTTINGSNSHHSSLLTITHEMSHIFVKSVLTNIYPSVSDKESLKKSLEMVRGDYHATNWLEAAQQLLVETIVSMHTHRNPRNSQVEDFTIDDWAKILRRWRHEVQEILVHTFDYIYFYAGEDESIKFYVESIWQSWSSIPDIGNRVEEYLLRTLCAISPEVLSSNPPGRYEASKAEVDRAFSNLIANGLPHLGYVEAGKEMLAGRWNIDNEPRCLVKAFGARIGLVRLVKIFLYSPALSAHLRGDWTLGPRSKDYGASSREYSQDEIINPIRFLTSVMKSNTSEAESLWVLHQIAFNYRSEEA